MQNDIWKYSLILGLFALLGLTIGYPSEAMLIAALGIIAWQIYQLHLIEKWVTSPSRNPLPETDGQFFLLHRQLNKRIKSNRRRKRQIKNYLKQFRHAVSVLPDAIVILNNQGKIQWANKNAHSLLNIRWPKDRDIRFEDLMRDSNVTNLFKYAAQHDTSIEVLDGIEITSKLKRDLVINLKVVPYTDDLKMVLARDVSRLVKVNRMHTDFIANVSHELKTPLTVLRGYLEIIQNMIDQQQAKNSPDTSDIQQAFFKPIKQMGMQSERMQMIVHDLLYLSKLEDGNNIKPQQTVDISVLIKSIVESIQAKINEREHTLHLDIDPNLNLIGNPNELHSAFTNLIVNAINYTPMRGNINVKWHRVSQENGHRTDGSAVLSVSDNGNGIPSSQIPRLTERFYRIDDNRSRESGGTGLGLAIVKHVLQRHDAQLNIDSQIDVGSTFRCIFPDSRIENLMTGEQK